MSGVIGCPELPALTLLSMVMGSLAYGSIDSIFCVPGSENILPMMVVSKSEAFPRAFQIRLARMPRCRLLVEGLAIVTLTL